MKWHCIIQHFRRYFDVSIFVLNQLNTLFQHKDKPSYYKLSLTKLKYLKSEAKLDFRSLHYSRNHKCIWIVKAVHLDYHSSAH